MFTYPFAIRFGFGELAIKQTQAVLQTITDLVHFLNTLAERIPLIRVQTVHESFVLLLHGLDLLMQLFVLPEELRVVRSASLRSLSHHTGLISDACGGLSARLVLSSLLLSCTHSFSLLLPTAYRARGLRASARTRSGLPHLSPHATASTRATLAPPLR